MRFFRGLLITLLVLAAVFTGGGLLLPSQVHVERSAVIKADAAAIFPYLINYRLFNEWSPWAPRDPNAEYTFSGPDDGVGAKMSWRSDKKEVGSGTQQIVALKQHEQVVTALDFGEMGTAQAQFDLAPESDGTRVTWSLDTTLPLNPLSRWMGLLLEPLIGADYEEGLLRLKAKVEGEPLTPRR